MLFSLGINRDRLNHVAEALKIRHFLKKRMPISWRDSVPDQQGNLKGEAGFKNIKWDQSDIFGLGQGPIYVLSDKTNETYHELVKNFTDELKALTLPNSNKKIARDVVAADTIYHGPFMKNSPDLVIDYNHGVRIAGIIGQKNVFSKPLIWKGENKKEGIFLGYGPDMTKSLEVSNLSILDLAPSILHLFGVAVSEDMDGKVRKDFFAKDSKPHSDDVKIVSESDLTSDQNTLDGDDEKIIEKRLKDLGYLG